VKAVPDPGVGGRVVILGEDALRRFRTLTEVIGMEAIPSPRIRAWWWR
jgi:hypothetical protein